MRTLLLVRHAKSSHDEASVADRDRPLTERGQKDARKMGNRLAERGVRVDLILSSPARRALATARRIARQLGYRRGAIVVENRLYPGQARALLTLLHALDGQLRGVMVVGHNPAIEELASHLSGTGIHLPTCAIAQLAFKVKSWSAIGSATLATVKLSAPKRRGGE